MRRGRLFSSAQSSSPVRLRRHRPGLHRQRRHQLRSARRRPRHGASCASVGLINRSAHIAAKHIPEHAPITDQAKAVAAPPLQATRRRLGPPSGLERAFPGAYVAGGLKPLHRLAYCSYVVPSDRSAATRGLPCHPHAPTSQATTALFPRRGSPPSAHGLRQAVGSSSPSSCTAVAPPHVTCTEIGRAHV